MSNGISQEDQADALAGLLAALAWLFASHFWWGWSWQVATALYFASSVCTYLNLIWKSVR